MTVKDASSDAQEPSLPRPSTAAESGREDPGAIANESEPVRSGGAEPAVPDAADDQYRAGAIDLLGILAYGALTAFERIAEDAALAPTLADKIELATAASSQIDHFNQVGRHLESLGAEVMAAMRPFHAPFDAFHEHTKPKDWYEGLVKVYVGDGFAADFYREVAAFVDPGTQAVVVEVLGADELNSYVLAQVRQGVERDPRLAGRLSLWGRRLVGEALSQAQRVAADRDALTSLLTGTRDRPGMDLAELSRMFSRLVAKHTKRMAELGLRS